LALPSLRSIENIHAINRFVIIHIHPPKTSVQLHAATVYETFVHSNETLCHAHLQEISYRKVEEVKKVEKEDLLSSIILNFFNFFDIGV
jgi:hypothetical protein